MTTTFDATIFIPPNPAPLTLWSYDFTTLGIGPQATLPTDVVAGTIALSRACANTTTDPPATVRVGEGDVVTGILANIARIGQESSDAKTRGLVFEAASTNNGYPSNIPATGGGGWAFVPGTGTATAGMAAPDGTSTATAITVPDSSSYNAFWMTGAMQSLSTWSFYYANGAISSGPGVTQPPMFINLNAASQPVEPFDVPIFNGNPIWHRFEQYVGPASALTFDQRVGFTEPQNVPLGVLTWGFQVEPGKIATELIPNTSTTVAASRQGEQLAIPNGAACFPGGRCNLNLEFRPKGDIGDYSLPVRLWSDPNDVTTYVEITSGRRLNVVVHGSPWSPAKILSWRKRTDVKFLISFGAGPSAAKYQSGGHPVVDLGASGTSFASIAPSGAMHALCSGTALQVTSRIQRVEGYPSAATPWTRAPQLSPQTVHIVQDGDSISAAFGLTNPATRGIVGQLEAYLGSKVGKIINLAVSGETLAGSPGMISKAPTYVDPLYDSFPVEICSGWGATNDLANGSPSAATVYASYTTYIQARQAAGFYAPAWTVMDRNSGTTPQGTFDTNRAAFNALVKANAMGADFIIDLTTDPNLDAVGAKNNATYFQVGGIHPTGGPGPSGCASIVAIAGPAFAAFIASKGF